MHRSPDLSSVMTWVNKHSSKSRRSTVSGVGSRPFWPVTSGHHDGGTKDRSRRGGGEGRGAERASNDADVSSIPPLIPYGGFSPVRLEGWPIRRSLPGSSEALAFSRHAPTDARFAVALRAPQGRSGCPVLRRAADRTMHRHGGWVALRPRGPRSGPGYAVPVRPRLTGPIRPTRRHIATSPQGGLYAMPSLCGSAEATREWFRAFATIPS